MKVRILNQSIRFRISMDEMNLLAKDGGITSTINFPSGLLTFNIQTGNQDHNIDLQNQNCQLILNKGQLINLHESDEISISFSQNELKVLFEKDFKCLTAREENEDDLYANPRSSH